MTNAADTARVLVVDDHPAVRYGLTLVLEREGFSVCAEEGCAVQAIARLPELDANLAVVDLSFDQGDGFNLIAALRGRAIPVLVYSMHEDAHNIQNSFRAGATCYVSKREDSRVFLEGVNAARQGSRYISPRAAHALAESERAPTEARCSARELQILELLGKGLGNSAIAEALTISVRTVETYCARLNEKLGLASMKDLRQFAIRNCAK
ncbi:response regulator transcription factor [Niveibacterium sp. 24ML]|uniref:response regulator n=1 Tax=Niveibacterium sp. 24ML TaxID=2985512 RepID=UPI00226FA743|nr:response regulator transcription factor [Niveibacterium sp. 24ML]MCX9158556.1 response regulator transcription factor [Niveibacterium sp. 24ML]